MKPIELRSEPEPILSNRTVLILGAAATLAVGCFALTRSSPSGPSRAPAELSPAESELLVELHKLRAAWHDDERARILANAPRMARRFDGPMGHLLDSETHSLLEQAVEYAGAMGVVDLAPALASLALSPRSLTTATRVKAMRAVERLQPWPVEVLARFITEGFLPVRIAAIQISAVRPDAPWPEIIGILTTPDEAANDGLEPEERDMVRAAVIAAIPSKLPEVLSDELWELVMVGKTKQAAFALRALAATSHDAKLVSKLTEHFDQLEGDAAIAGLELFGRWARPLPNNLPVWTVVMSNHATIDLRARALYCLERTGSFDITELLDALPSLPLRVRYFAARCLLKSGNEAGFASLLDLIESAQEARARQLLAWLTGKGPGSDRVDFELQKERALRTLRGRRLPNPEFEVAVPVL